MPVSFALRAGPACFSTIDPYVPFRTNTGADIGGNKMCYTYNHNYFYKPHTAYGRIGTTAAGYLASSKRI